MNTGFVRAAVVFACALNLSWVRAEPAYVRVAASPAAIPSAVTASVSSLSLASVQALPGFPVKAYRDGHRRGRVLLKYTINADGAVSDVELMEATPAQVFARTPMANVSAWRFSPSGVNETRTVEFLFNVE